MAEAMPDPKLPDGAVAYHRSPTFDEQSVPQKLTKKHTLKEGAWGRLHVEAGSLRFVDLTTGRSQVIEAGSDHVIEPQAGQRRDRSRGWSVRSAVVKGGLL